MHCVAPVARVVVQVARVVVHIQRDVALVDVGDVDRAEVAELVVLGDVPTITFFCSFSLH